MLDVISAKILRAAMYEKRELLDQQTDIKSACQVLWLFTVLFVCLCVADLHYLGFCWTFQASDASSVSKTLA